MMNIIIVFKVIVFKVIVITFVIVSGISYRPPTSLTVSGS